jgi:hypothetical protein
MAYVSEGLCPKCKKRDAYGWGRTPEEALIYFRKHGCTACELKKAVLTAFLIGLASWALIQVIVRLVK